jgi:sporulation protein YpjB
MKKLIAGISVFFLFFSFNTVKGYAKIDQETSLIEKSLSLVQDGDYVHGANLLEQLESKYMASAKKNKDFTPKELETISVTFQNAHVSLTNDAIDPQEKVADVLGLRLLIDAGETTMQPMWKEMKKSVMTPLQNMESAYKRGNSEAYETQLNQFLHQFEIIYPSLIMDLPYDEVKKINSLVSFLDDYRINQESIPAFQQKLDETKSELLFIFDQGNSIIPPVSIWTIFTTGIIIVGTLSYVGWRKYIGDRNKNKKRREHND